MMQIVVGIFIAAILLVIVAIFFLPLYGIDYVEALPLALGLSLISIGFPLRTFLINTMTAQENNRFVITASIGASIISIIAAFLFRGLGFLPCVLIYLYTLNSLFILFLFCGYFFSSKSNDSMRSAQS
jgi:O-antigen/teichoic acid export membrane protein